MSWQRVSLRHGGHWEQSAYVGGDSVAIHIMCSEISYVDLINQIRSVLNAPEDRDYVIFYLEAQRSKVSLQNDTDLLRFIVQGKVTNHVLFLTERRQYRSKNANVGGTYSEADNVSITPPQPPSCTEPDDEEVFTSDDERAERDKELNDSLIQEFSDWLQHLKKKRGLWDPVNYHLIINRSTKNQSWNIIYYYSEN